MFVLGVRAIGLSGFLSLCAAVHGPAASLRATTDSPFGAEASGASFGRISQLINALPSVETALEAYWPGFWTSTCGFVVADSDGLALLFIPSARRPEKARPACGTTSWAKVSNDSLPVLLHGRVFEASVPSLAGTSPIIRPNFDAGGRNVLAVSRKGSYVEALEFAIHETFHQFQEGRFARLIGLNDLVSDSIVDDSLFRRNVEIERVMLQNVLLARSTKATRALATRYLRARRARLSLVSQRVEQVERLMERKEGTAEIVGLYALAAAEKRPLVSTVRDSTIALLKRPLEQFPEGMDRTWRLMRWRLYGTGAALGLVLTRLHVPWKGQVQQGAGLDEILERALRPLEPEERSHPRQD
jgi:hypothetical protein